MEAINIIGTVVRYCWDMLAFEMPGLGVSCKAFVTAVMLINFSIIVIHYAFGFGGSGYRSGQSNRKYISEKRKGDTH